ncbi:MAG: hypothetical protein O3A83_02955 [Proteobacteria bacterium]|nr:hypothetical protein [Pseudomonadota bacterium]
MIKKQEKKILKQILKVPKKLPNSKTKIVMSPKSYNQLFKDLGNRANIKITATKLKKGGRRKVI